MILAAGRSTRMGRPKQLLDIAGKPMLQHVVDAAAASVLEETIVVLDAAAGEIEAALTLPAAVRLVRVGGGSPEDVGVDTRLGGIIGRVDDASENPSVGPREGQAYEGRPGRDERPQASDEQRLADSLRSSVASGLADSLRAGLEAASDEAIAAAVLLGDQPEVTSAIIDAVVAAFRSSGSPCARPLYSAAGKAIPGHPVVLARSLWPAIRALRGDRGAGPLLAEHPEWVCEVRVEGTPPIDVDRAEDYDAVRSRLG